MPSLSVPINQTEEVLDEVLRIVKEEYDHPNSVLSETDRNKFVGEERSLRKRLKEAVQSESNSWRIQSLLGLPSPQAAKCLEEAEDLRQRVKDDVNSKWRARLTGRSNVLGLSFNLMGTRTPEMDTPAGGNTGRESMIIPSPLNLPGRSASEVSESNVGVDPIVQNDRDYSSDLNEAINTPLGTSIDRNGVSSTPRRRRSPPPPPPPRRMALPSDSRILSGTTGNPGTQSPRRSPSIRRPAPPPPQSPNRQSRVPRSPTFNIPGPIPLPSAQGPLDPAIISSITEFAQQMNTFASSMAKQAQGRQRLRCSDEYVTKTNCVDINGSNVDGLTLNNGGSNNSGAVIHKTVLPPPRSPQRV